MSFITLKSFWKFIVPFADSKARIFKLQRSPRIDSKESIPLGNVALAGRYDNAIPLGKHKSKIVCNGVG
jgi:hypothetical protein